MIYGCYLEDVSKWLISLVIVSPLTGVVGPLPNGLNGLQIGVTNNLLTGMILQVRDGHSERRIGWGRSGKS